MLTPAIRLQQQLAAGQTVVGVMATDHVWPLLIELCQQSGIDYLVLDREHGPHSDETVAHVCQVARLADFPVLMRTVSCEPDEIRRAVDLGPSGLILPCVERVEQLDSVRDAVRMPPRGSRRPGGVGNYWMRDFHYETWRDAFERHFIVIPQIESQAGVAAASQLAAHELTTALGVGPYDLSADLGCCWNPDDPRHRQALNDIRAAAEAVGKTVWIGCDAVALQQQGYHFLWLGSISGLLVDRLAAGVNAVKPPGA